MTCETCPPYVRKCAHLGRKSVLWLIVTPDAKAEFARRTNQIFSAINGIEAVTCPGCGTPLGTGFAAFVIGPGVVEEPLCVCRIPLSCHVRNQRKYMVVKAAEQAFAIVVGRNSMKVLR